MSVDAVVSALARVAGNSAPSEDHPELAGHFANVIDIGEVKLCVGTDGVGTKLLLATEPEHFHGLAVDSAAMNANDLICVGAVPLAIVDYIACASARRRPRADPRRDRRRLHGRGGAGRRRRRRRRGGSPTRDHRLSCGRGSRSRPRGHGGGDGRGGDPRRLSRRAGRRRRGDRLDGPHSNGFTALRRLLDDEKVDLDGPAPWGGGDGTTPGTRAHATVVAPRLMAVLAGRDLHAAANVTGGGVTDLGTGAAHLRGADPRVAGAAAAVRVDLVRRRRRSPTDLQHGSRLHGRRRRRCGRRRVRRHPPAFDATVIGRLADDLAPAASRCTWVAWRSRATASTSSGPDNREREPDA